MSDEKAPTVEAMEACALSTLMRLARCGDDSLPASLALLARVDAARAPLAARTQRLDAKQESLAAAWAEKDLLMALAKLVGSVRVGEVGGPRLAIDVDRTAVLRAQQMLLAAGWMP